MHAAAMRFSTNEKLYDNVNFLEFVRTAEISYSVMTDKGFDGFVDNMAFFILSMLKQNRLTNWKLPTSTS